MLKKYIIFLGALLFVMMFYNLEGNASENAEVNEVQTLGGKSLDVLTKVVKAHDGGYIAIGTIGYDDPIEDDYRYLYFPFPKSVVIKFNKDMVMEWTKYYNDVIHYIDDIMLVKENSYILVGHYDNNRVILKLNSEGDVLWQQDGPLASWNKHSVVGTQDNGFIIAGRIYENEDTFFEFVRYDESGIVVWKKNIPLSNYRSYRIFKIVRLNDGYAVNATATKCKVKRDKIDGCEKVNIIIKLDKNANVIWSKEIDHEVGDMIVKNNGNLVIVGHQKMINERKKGLFLIETKKEIATYAKISQLDSRNGDVIWKERYGGESKSEFYFTSVTEDNEGNLIASGYTHNYPLPSFSTSYYQIIPYGERDYNYYLANKTNYWLTLTGESIITDTYLTRDMVDINAIMVKYNRFGQKDWETMNAADASLSVIYDDESLITVGYESVERTSSSWGNGFDAYYAKAREDQLSLVKIDNYDHKAIEKYNAWILTRRILLISGITLGLFYIKMKRNGSKILFISFSRGEALINKLGEQGVKVIFDNKGYNNIIVNRNVIAHIKVYNTFTFIKVSTKEGRKLINECLK